ncbi:hypothetical protein LSAT2_013471 [Lamellibrachia satsuma]|nr:hypothetical protein LSAT2_013471 [Lamellibrachia satsuma]
MGEDWQKLLVDMLARLLKLGMFLSHQPKVQPKNATDTLREKVPELLPEQGMLAHLLDNDEKCVEAVREFAERYELPYDTFLDTDLLWPIPVNTMSFA